MNSLNLRAENRRKIINFLYESSGATKKKIAKSLNLSVPTVTLILKDLTELGLVQPAGTLQSSGGRKPTAVHLAYDSKYSVGIAITLYHIRLVVINLGEEIVHYKCVSHTFENTAQYYQYLADELEIFLNDHALPRNKLLGVGLALPGIVNTDKLLLEYSPTLQVHDLPVQAIAKFIPYPVLADNEANLAGLAEIWRINDVESAIYLSINKGVGGAIILQNKIYSGATGHSGEFGHMTIVKDGLTCSCGKRGCLEAYCSTNILTDPNFNDVEEFFSALKMGNQYCIRKWQSYLDYLATGINNIRMIFNCDIILGGEISQYLEADSNLLSQRLLGLNPFNEQPNYLHYSKFKDKASATGAALLFVDDYLDT
ncbi:MAG: ROK family transcriptional regulator [Oscillospiraceae bacterium]|jgi:predicted NBD/HSP70 family sugar kinase|nr:ROK family transcriptional regulator [Oscillospiraceae bacterium]